jgi:hypothetical protein
MTKSGEKAHLSQILQGRIKESRRRTFGGMPLIMGINKIYKNNATVKRPDNADAPTNGLTGEHEY